MNFYITHNSDFRGRIIVAFDELKDTFDGSMGTLDRLLAANRPILIIGDVEGHFMGPNAGRCTPQPRL